MEVQALPYLSTQRGNTLYYEEKGRTGRSVVLVHDWGTNLRAWDGIVGALAANYRVVSFDLSGHGRSEVANCVHKIELFADDIASVLEGIDVWNPALVGWSMGGQACLNYLMRGGLDAASLVLVGTSPYLLNISPYQTNWTADFIKEIERMAAMPRPAFLKRFMDLYFSSDVGSETVDWLAGMALETPAWVTAECSASQFETDARTLFRELTIPTLVMHGRLDRICTFDSARFISEQMGGLAPITFELSGHSPHIEERDAFVEALTAFLG